MSRRFALDREVLPPKRRAATVSKKPQPKPTLKVPPAHRVPAWPSAEKILRRYE
jgi:hypothetical protein